MASQIQLSKSNYELIQQRLSLLMHPTKLREMRISGKREEGYREAILAAKSLMKELFKDIE